MDILLTSAVIDVFPNTFYIIYHNSEIPCVYIKNDPYTPSLHYAYLFAHSTPIFYNEWYITSSCITTVKLHNAKTYAHGLKKMHCIRASGFDHSSIYRQLRNLHNISYLKILEYTD